MASIKLDSKTVIEACEKVISESKKHGPPVHDNYFHADKIKRLAEYSPSRTTNITHEDFALIGEYLPKPTTYHKD